MNRHFLLLALFTLIGFFSFGQYNVQSKYFVYLQTEPAQPFYIKISGQQISANASGYLILPQLKDGDYKLTVGFPQNKTPEQVFNFKIDSKDKGYLIKDFGAEGWGLFDLQTMAVQKSIKGSIDDKAVAATAPAKQEPKKDVAPAEGVSDFTKVLSQAANDPTLLQKPKPQPVEPPVKKEVAQATPAPENTNEVPAEKVIEEDVAVTQVEKPREVVKNKSTKSKNKNSGNGVMLVYDDRNESGQVDPVTIFIPEPKNDNSEKNQQKKTNTQKVEEDVVIKSSANETETPKEDAPKATDNFTVKEMPPIPQKADGAKVSTQNDVCKSIAGEDDFLKLRRAMAAEDNDDKMIAEAEKAFKNKCYTTSQIKYLSSMFLSNAGKYNFYKAAHAHISDKENFSSLAEEIKDDSYKQKFNSLLK